MIKSIIKETTIVLLVLVVVTLLLGILFYDYIPINKTVPIKIEEYKMPNEIEEELGKKVLEEKAIVKTYTVDGADLTLYEDYDKGKKNPFSVVNNGEEVPPVENPDGGTTGDKTDETPNIKTTK